MAAGSPGGRLGPGRTSGPAPAIQRRQLATASVVLGAVSAVAFWCLTFPILIVAIAGLVCGVLGLKSEHTHWLAVLGIILNSLVIVIALLAFAVWALMVGGPAMP